MIIHRRDIKNYVMAPGCLIDIDLLSIKMHYV